MKRGSITAVLVLVAGTACQTARPTSTLVGPVPPSPPPPTALHWVRTSAEFRAATTQAFRIASRRVEIVGASMQPGTWAVSLDADETVLDNSLYAKERMDAHLGYTPETWRAWVARRAAVPIPGSAQFLRRVKEMGGTIAIVTNRTMAECPDTEETFRALQLPFDLMLCRPDGAPPDKLPRYESIMNGTARPGLGPLDIVLWVGDNIQDFPMLSQGDRRSGEVAFAEFGSRYIIIPNPVYGSWEKNFAE
jgi:5'-nucleotidase (lipoprotein e(P4) family)